MSGLDRPRPRLSLLKFCFFLIDFWLRLFSFLVSFLHMLLFLLPLVNGSIFGVKFLPFFVYMVSVKGTGVWYIGHGHEEGVKGGLLGSQGFTVGWSSKLLVLPGLASSGLIAPALAYSCGIPIRSSEVMFSFSFCTFSSAQEASCWSSLPFCWTSHFYFFLFGGSISILWRISFSNNTPTLLSLLG